MAAITPLARLMQGNEAIAAGALDAGVNFYAGYPITPSTEIAEIMAGRLPRTGGKFIQMEDEISGMAAVIGASLAGLKAMTATSGPGFSLMQENIGFAAMAEVPCLIVNSQRLGPSTGVPTAPAQGDVMQARWGTHGDRPVIALCPSSVSECYLLTIRAVNLAEKFRTPVLLLADEVIGHLRERVVLPGPGEIPVINRRKPPAGQKNYRPYRAGEDGVPVPADFGTGCRYHVTGLAHDESGAPTNSPEIAEALIRRIHSKIYDHLDEICDYETWLAEDADVLIVAYGAVARPARKAVKEARAAGIRAGLFRPVTVWPFPAEQMAELAKAARVLIVPEMNMGQLIREVELAAGGRARVAGLNRVNGELISPSEIMDCIRQFSSQ